MKRVLNYMKQRWYYYLAGALAMSVGIWLDMQTPIVTGRLVDDVIKAGNTSIFTGLILTLLGITLGRAVFGYMKEIAFDLAGVHVVKDLRQDLFDHIQGLSQNFFEEKNTGELMARLKEDGDKLWHGISFGIMLVIEMGVTLVIAVVLMLRIHVTLSLITFTTLPIIGWLAWHLSKEVDDIYGKISEKNAELNTTAQENIAGVRLVKAFAREKYEVKKFLEHNQGYYDLNMAYAKTIGRRFPSIQMLSNLLPVVAIVIGGAFVINADLSIGTLTMFMGYSYLIVWPVRLIGWLSSIMAEAYGAVKKIDTVFNSEAEIFDKEDAQVLERCLGYVSFEDVTLALNGREILKNINFNIKPGQTLAIMGATGTGKTSIINLLERFYEPTEGQVLVDGRDISTLTLTSLRNKVAVVMQETFLFSDTIANNIHFGNDSQKAVSNIEGAAASAQAHEFVERMDEGYETVIGERGVGLSGGQKQRISIARAFSKEAKILIMDDATSALDMETEHQIQKEVAKRKDATKIIIAHRISAVKDADEIIILDKGEIVERGTHKQLLAKQGRYFETFNEQYEGFSA